MLHQPEPLGLLLELGLGGAGAGDQEAHVAEPLDQARQGVEREVEALLVDEPADEQDQPLVRPRVAGAQPRQVGDRLQVAGVDAVGDRGDLRGGDPEHVGDVAAHVVRAGDHAVGVADHPPLDRVDVALRVLVDPALVAAVLGRVHGHEPRHAGVAGQLAGGAGDQPVVRVHEVGRDLLDQLRAGGAHVLVHVVDPGDERVEVVLGEVGLAHAVDDHAVAVLRERRRRRA